MDAAMVSSVMSLIPERTARTQSGVQFTPEAASCRYPDRIAHVAKFLHWLSPLASLSIEDQQVLGLRNAQGRPVHAADLEDEALDAEEAEQPAAAQCAVEISTASEHEEEALLV